MSHFKFNQKNTKQKKEEIVKYFKEVNIMFEKIPRDSYRMYIKR